MRQTISWDDNSCAICGASKKTHDELMSRFGSIRYPVRVRPLVAYFSKDPAPEYPDSPFEYRECRKFVKKFEIFDRDGQLVPPYNSDT